jgi:hypothetical protein
VSSDGPAPPWIATRDAPIGRYSHLRQELQKAVVLPSKLRQPPTIDPENDTKLAAPAVLSLRFQPYDSWVLIQLRR